MENRSASTKTGDDIRFTEIAVGNVSFESTWNFGQSKDVSQTISTQTDPLPAKKDQETCSQELKAIMTQTEPWFNTASTNVNESKLLESLRKLVPVMEEELKNGTTTVFKF